MALHLAPPDPATTGVLPENRAGDRIGRYKLLQKIGEGGMGIVYMAEQEEPIRRRVALKVIKLGMDTKSVIARFEAERQALAMMDHPNIAKVLDAGATENGRPYFVMELVRGTKITEYCDQKNLTTGERLELFTQTCQAIQHAHQKGIIHRDIKPSNILVTTNDGALVPKVIDFGVAKATAGQQLTNRTLFTAFEQFIGTPAYMSPEQAEMTSLDVDTRSDIYSLGVLLYELLTGKTPFDAKELLALGMDAMRRTIREKEPLKPSTRLTQELIAASRQSAAGPYAGNGDALPRRRYGEIQKLIHLLRGDLDWIVMKALDKDRTRRYETANALAMDIKRHLNNEAVLARPPSNLYRLQKLARRHRGPIAAAVALVGMLILGAVASATYALKASRAEKQAEAEATHSRKVLTFLVNVLGAGTQIFSSGDRQITVHAATQLKETELTEAEVMFREVLVLQNTQFGSNSVEVARTMNNLAALQEQKGDLALAEATRRQAIAMMEKTECNACPHMVRSLHDLAELLEKRGDVPGAEKLHRQAIGLAVTNQARYQPEELDLVKYRAELNASYGFLSEAAPDLARALELEPGEHRHYYLLAPLLIQQGDLAGYRKVSEAMLEQFAFTVDPVLAERASKTYMLLPGGPNLSTAINLADITISRSATNHPDLAYFEFAKALAEYRQGRNDAAAEWTAKSLDQGAPWAPAFNSTREIMTLALQAMALHHLKKPASAQESLQRALKIRERDAPKRAGQGGGTLWVDWMTCDIFLREAKGLIEGKGTDSRPLP